MLVGGVVHSTQVTLFVSPVCLCSCRFVHHSVITHSGPNVSCTGREVTSLAHTMSALHMLMLRKQCNYERAITMASWVQGYPHANSLQHSCSAGEGNGAFSL